MITKIFGENCKRAVVFDLLLSHPYSEYTKTDIKEITGIARGTLNTFIDELVEYGIIKPTKSVGNGLLYQLNLKSTVTQALNSFQNQLADIEFEKEMKELQKTDPEIVPIKPFEKIVINNSNYILGFSNILKELQDNKTIVTLPVLESTGKANFYYEKDSFGITEQTIPLTATAVGKKIDVAQLS